jgi:hypothetical protein
MVGNLDIELSAIPAYPFPLMRERHTQVNERTEHNQPQTVIPGRAKLPMQHESHALDGDRHSPAGSDRLGEGVCAESRGDYDRGEFKESDVGKAERPDC